MGVWPSSPDLAGWREIAFVGELLEVSLLVLILGRTLVVVFGGSPSLVACFCWAVAMGDLMSR